MLIVTETASVRKKSVKASCCRQPPSIRTLAIKAGLRTSPVVVHIRPQDLLVRAVRHRLGHQRFDTKYAMEVYLLS